MSHNSKKLVKLVKQSYKLQKKFNKKSQTSEKK